jgi:hypothetical protein
MRLLRPFHIVAGVALACLLSIGSAARSSDALPAKDVVRGCRDFMNTMPREHFLLGVCSGVVQSLLASGRDLKTAPFCPPETVTTAQAAELALTYINARPQRLEEPFQRLAAEAFATAWPCR